MALSDGGAFNLHILIPLLINYHREGKKRSQIKYYGYGIMGLASEFKRTTGNLSSVDSTEFKLFPGLVIGRGQKVFMLAVKPYTFPGFFPVLSRYELLKALDLLSRHKYIYNCTRRMMQRTFQFWMMMQVGQISLAFCVPESLWEREDV